LTQKGSAHSQDLRHAKAALDAEAGTWPATINPDAEPAARGTIRAARAVCCLCTLLLAEASRITERLVLAAIPMMGAAPGPMPDARRVEQQQHSKPIPGPPALRRRVPLCGLHPILNHQSRLQAVPLSRAGCHDAIPTLQRRCQTMVPIQLILRGLHQEPVSDSKVSRRPCLLACARKHHLWG
jgi:hypothetical protein